MTKLSQGCKPWPGDLSLRQLHHIVSSVASQRDSASGSAAGGA